MQSEAFLAAGCLVPSSGILIADGKIVVPRYLRVIFGTVAGAFFGLLVAGWMLIGLYGENPKPGSSLIAFSPIFFGLAGAAIGLFLSMRRGETQPKS